MLLAANVKYHLARAYYVQSKDNRGLWQGQGAQNLGLSAEIQAKDYLRLLKGRSPQDKGEYLTPRKLNLDKRISGTDFVFCAPKSISLQALLERDASVRLAHWWAVQQAIAQMEKRVRSIIYWGAYGERKRKALITGNCIVACFEHIEARPTLIHRTTQPEDPHLHTHCLMMNLTELPNGQWRSLYNVDIFNHIREIRQVYHDHLGDNLKQLGFPLRKEGFWWEIATYSREMIEAFSTRNQTINQLRADPSFEDLSYYDLWLKTRGQKRQKTDDDSFQQWLHKQEKIQCTPSSALADWQLSEILLEKTSNNQQQKSDQWQL